MTKRKEQMTAAWNQVKLPQRHIFMMCCLTPLDARECGKKNRKYFSCGPFAFLCANDFWKAFIISEHNFFTQIRQLSV